VRIKDSRRRILGLGRMCYLFGLEGGLLGSFYFVC
jgi:hypothetical protein